MTLLTCVKSNMQFAQIGLNTCQWGRVATTACVKWDVCSRPHNPSSATSQGDLQKYCMCLIGNITLLNAFMVLCEPWLKFQSNVEGSKYLVRLSLIMRASFLHVMVIPVISHHTLDNHSYDIWSILSLDMIFSLYAPLPTKSLLKCGQYLPNHCLPQNMYPQEERERTLCSYHSPSISINTSEARKLVTLMWW